MTRPSPFDGPVERYPDGLTARTKGHCKPNDAGLINLKSGIYRFTCVRNQRHGWHAWVVLYDRKDRPVFNCNAWYFLAHFERVPTPKGTKP